VKSSLRVSFVGAGNVAGHMAMAMLRKGLTISNIISLKRQNSVHLADMVGAHSIDHLDDITKNTDIIIVAVKDDSIADIAAKLKTELIVAHTSGTVELPILNSVGKNTGVFYPLQTFSGDTPISFREVPILIEGSNTQTTDILTELAEMISDKVLLHSSEERKRIHLSAVFACNFTNHLLAIAQDLLTCNECSFDLLHPLIKETMRKALAENPHDSQTGPARRGDTDVIDNHRFMLNRHPMYLEIYNLITQSIQETKYDG
jgi:predicted short-subunit dehydrogenase-like oxidoreductase (DUF2520 family)